uniref:Uncharacterized protein n=1 Tax=Meleagris gallopavo TaxID=9103 RepID=A0A803YDA6_MELGA
MHRNARFLFDFFDKLKPEHNIIPNPSQQDSSTKQICRIRCQKGWISYQGHCYMLIQERMTWLEAEVLGCSKRECLSFLLCFPQLFFVPNSFFLPFYVSPLASPVAQFHTSWVWPLTDSSSPFSTLRLKDILTSFCCLLR